MPTLTRQNITGYRSNYLELTPSLDVVLHTKVIEDWQEAQKYHDEVRRHIEERGRILYSTLLNLEGLQGGPSSCCGGSAPSPMIA